MKILYLMHVNWYWIRQRPHVFAEGLASAHTVRLAHFAMYHHHHRVADRPPPGPDHTLWRIPERLLRTVPGAQAVHRSLVSFQVRRLMQRHTPDLLWLTHPSFVAALAGLQGQRVVYDCMDDHLAFSPESASSVARDEFALVSKADMTLFSSRTLMDRVQQRSPVRQGHVINNGVGAHLLDRLETPSTAARTIDPQATRAPTVGYFGTISHWFDWPTVLGLLEAVPNARLRLAGPVETTVPRHPRIEHVGTLAHAELPGFVNACDVLAMPFLVNRLIEAVDPVKLYEYIAFCKPALAPRYGETLRFEPWVTLYDSGTDASLKLKQLLASTGPTQGEPSRRTFLLQNTWESRISQVLHRLPTRATPS
jgi:teichuronic acid biosynthesis glycosyltransferase TuaH